MSENNPPPIAYIIWFGMLISQVIYASIPLVLEIEAQGVDDMLLIVFGGVGMMMALVAMFGVPLFVPNDSNTGEFPFRRFVIQNACAEVPAIMGFVAVFLGAQPTFQYSLAAVGIMALFYISPFFSKRV